MNASKLQSAVFWGINNKNEHRLRQLIILSHRVSQWKMSQQKDKHFTPFLAEFKNFCDVLSDVNQ